MKKNVIIFTNSGDSHADLVIPHIEKLGGTYCRVNSDTLDKDFIFSINYQSEKTQVLTPHIFGGDGSQSTAWIRRPFSFWKTPRNAREKLTKQDLETCIRYIIETLPETIKIVDKPSVIARANKKLSQLHIAKRIGFEIPKTLITNSPEEAKQFYLDNKKNIIVKSIDKFSAAVKNDFLSVFTTKVTDDMDFGLVKNCPSLFQENIGKRKELRITVIGRKIFTVEIDSQAMEESKIDWRKVNHKLNEIPHKVVDLPKNIEILIFKLLDQYGLHFGTVDMAITPENKYIFFEINPAGQFLWLEPLTGLPLAHQMAEYLLS